MNYAIRLLLTALCLLTTTAISAQIKIGYYDYDSVISSMADYKEAESNMANIRQQYDAEMQRSLDDFSQKYEDFLDNQASYEPSILKKRQSELEDLYKRNIEFLKEATQLLADHEKALMAPVKERLKAAVSQMGKDEGFDIILKSSDDNISYINCDISTDITEELINRLQ